MRVDGRSQNEIRPVKITTGYLKHPAGSCLIEMGNTRVVCSAILEDSVPPFLKNSGKGWLTAEYSMLPASSSQRIQRERSKVGGRTQEIQRLIGRSLRSCVNLSMLGERSILIDCDVLDADGGTRTASITGSYVAVALALNHLEKKYSGISKALQFAVAAVSVGIVGGTPVLDLNYPEDKDAEVDMNIVMTSKQEYIEVQGTAEGKPFKQTQLNHLLELASQGIAELFSIQQEAINKK
jgi:ribonuclease PH